MIETTDEQKDPKVEQARIRARKNSLLHWLPQQTHYPTRTAHTLQEMVSSSAVPSDSLIDVEGLIDEYREIWPEELKQYFEGLPESVRLADKFYRSHCFNSRSLIGPGCPLSEEERPNLVVISESHGRTKPDLLGQEISEKYHESIPEQFRPAGHLNLVHCLSYGEAWLVEGGLGGNTAARSGTPEFWKMLAIMSGELTAGDVPITEENWKTAFSHLAKTACEKKAMSRKPAGMSAKSEPRTETKDSNPKPLTPANQGECKENDLARLKVKIRILIKLQERRIKLLDLSLAHIYLASGTKTVTRKDGKGTYYTPRHKLSQTVQKKLHCATWERYLKPLLQQVRPHNIVFVGKFAGRAISQKEIQEFCDGTGTNYHSVAIEHPCYNGKNNGMNHRENMSILQQLVRETQMSSPLQTLSSSFEAKQPTAAKEPERYGSSDGYLMPSKGSKGRVRTLIRRESNVEPRSQRSDTGKISNDPKQSTDTRKAMPKLKKQKQEAYLAK